MLDFLDSIDRELLLWLNSFHSPFWDTVMIFITGKLQWLPLYIFIIGFLFYRFKKKAWVYTIAIFVTFALTDVISTKVFKNGIERLRPCKNEEVNSLLHMPNGCGGWFGFFSSHASNTFGLASFLFFLYKTERRKWSLMFLWAFIVSYSRIYLGKHYPFDILCGAMFGTLTGYIAYCITQKIERKWLHKT